MKFLLAATTVVVALSSVVEALDRDKMLDVVATVHSNHKILTKYDDVAKDREEEVCYANFTSDTNIVCASNGQKYTNLSMFNYRKCKLKIQEGTEIELADMKFCDGVDVEDMEHIE